ESVAPMTRDAVSGRFEASVPAQAAGTLIRYRIKAVSEQGAARLYPAQGDLSPTLSAYVHERWDRAEIPFGFIIHVGNRLKEADATQQRKSPFAAIMARFARGNAQSNARPPRGSSAFVYVDQKTGKTTLFDYVNVDEREGDRGYRVHFHKDHTLGGMTAVN